MVKHTEPSIFTRVLDIKSKLTGEEGVVDSDNQVRWSRANPKAITVELRKQISKARLRIAEARALGINTEVDESVLDHMIQSQNTASLVCLAGDRDSITQVQRSNAATVLADALYPKSADSTPEEESSRKIKRSIAYTYFAASLGYKKAQEKIKSWQK